MGASAPTPPSTESSAFRGAQLEYLALTSRVLPWGRPTERPVSVIAKGTTSTGKSHTTQTVLKFMPASAFVDLGSMSRRFLFYDDEPYEHRFLIVPEWASIAEDDELVALLRILLSEGRIITFPLPAIPPHDAASTEEDS